MEKDIINEIEVLLDKLSRAKTALDEEYDRVTINHGESKVVSNEEFQGLSLIDISATLSDTYRKLCNLCVQTKIELQHELHDVGKVKIAEQLHNDFVDARSIREKLYVLKKYANEQGR